MSDSLERSTSQRGAARPLLILVALVVVVAVVAALWFASSSEPEPPPTPPATAAPAPPTTMLPPVTAPSTTAPPTTVPAPPPTTTPPATTPDPEADAAFGRSFVGGVTRAESSAMPPGFLPPDEGAPDMKVARSAGVPAKLEFDVDPPHVRPGDAYTVRIVLRNTGGRPLSAAALSVETTRDGDAREQALPVASDAVAPGKSLLLAELSGTWPAGARQWSLDARLTTERGEVYRAELVWR